jgi:hypothetical protein
VKINIIFLVLLGLAGNCCFAEQKKGAEETFVGRFAALQKAAAPVNTGVVYPLSMIPQPVDLRGGSIAGSTMSWHRSEKQVVSTNVVVSEQYRGGSEPYIPYGGQYCGGRVAHWFDVDGSTLAFTEGSRGPECTALPIMSWKAKGGRVVSAGIEPLRGLEVNSLWHAGDYLIFYVDRAPQAYGLAFWNIKDHNWDIVSSFDIAFLSSIEYGTASFGQIPGGVILRSSVTLVAFFPGKREWVLLEPAVDKDGHIPLGRVRLLAEDLVKKPFNKAFSTVQEFATASVPLMVELPKGAGKEACFCFCAEMWLSKLPDDYIAKESMSWIEKDLAVDQFGCFLVPQNAPERLITLGFFPSRRGRDYRGECLGVNSDNIVITRGIGDTYGDQQVLHGYKVDTVTGEVKVLPKDSFHVPEEMLKDGI